MKKHNTFVIQWFKKIGHPELIDLWCSKENQTEFLKLRVPNSSEKRRCTCYILFCIDRRPILQTENPYLPNTRITALLATEWREHRDNNDTIYKKYKLLDTKQVFMKKHETEIQQNYPHLTEENVNLVLEKMFDRVHLREHI